MSNASPFLNEVILAFGTREGVVPMRRADYYQLCIENGWSKREADTMAFGPYRNRAPADVLPFSIDEAREAA